LRPSGNQPILSDDIRERFRQIIEQIAEREKVEAAVLTASANYIQFILGGLGNRDLAALVNLIKDETARGILIDWPVFRFIASEGKFWDDGFIYTCHSAETIEAALDYIRQQGDVDLFGRPNT
jgi:REP element-mobilizing transposase RayT